MNQSKSLGQFEELVLLATLHLRDEAYGAKIRQSVANAVGRTISIGAVYATLDRLERKGYVKSWHGPATAERGGRAKRYFRVEGSGEVALVDAEAIRKRLVRLTEASST